MSLHAGERYGEPGFGGGGGPPAGPRCFERSPKMSRAAQLIGLIIVVVSVVVGCAKETQPAVQIKRETQAPIANPPTTPSSAAPESRELLWLQDGAVGELRGGRVVQIIDPINMLVSIELGSGDSQLVWLTEFDTSFLADGSPFTRIPGFEWRVDGRKEYDSVFGKRTVFVVRPNSSLWRRR